MGWRNPLAAAVFLSAAFSAVDGWAITRTWVGGNGTTVANRTDWNRAANWSPAAVPTPADLVVIPTAPTGNPLPGFFPTLAAPAAIAQLQVQTGATLTLNATLTVGNATTGPLIDGAGTVAGAGLLQVTNGPLNGTLFNGSITVGAFTLNAPVGRNLGIASGVTVTCNGAVNVTQSEVHVGAAAGAPSTLHINGALTVAAAGTLNMRAPASTLRLSGTLTLIGAWNAGTSTLFLDPTTNQTLNVTAGAPRQFWNVTIQSDAGGNRIDGDLITPTATMTINNNLTLTRGQFQIGNFTVIVGGTLLSGATTQSLLHFTSTGILRARGNVDLAALLQPTSQVGGPFASIILDGTALQTFIVRATSSTQMHDIDHFQVSNPAGAIVLDGGSDFTVNGELRIDANCMLTVRDVFDPESPMIMGANSTLRLENIIRADSTIVGSTFTSGAGSTIVYAGQAIDQTVYSRNSTGGSIPYQNLIIDNTGALASLQNASNDLIVNGTFTILGAGSSFTMPNSRTMFVRQSFISNGAFTGQSGSTVFMIGTGSIAGTAPSLVFENLLVDGAVTDVVTAQRSFTTNAIFQVAQGALTTAGAVTMTALLGMSVGNGSAAAGSADLNLVGPATLQIGSGQTFSVNGIDGRFTSVAGGGANPTLTRSGAGTFVATINGQANLFGLNFSFGDINGLNFTTSATIERLRNVRFTNINAGANAHHLTITTTGLDLDAPGCMFDTVGGAQWNVWAVDSSPGNGIPVRLRFEQRTASNAIGDIGGPGSGEPRDGDDDTNDDGVILAPETATLHGGAIVQWVYTANVDMTGVIQGFPLPAFDWNTFTYYSTYVLMQTSTGGVDTIYVLNTDGDLQSYSFSLTSPTERIIGPIFWDTEGASHVVYFGTSTGTVHRLIDTGASLVPAPGPWSTPFQIAGTLPEVTTPVVSDRTNVYFGGRSSAAGYEAYAIDIATKTMMLSPATPLGSVRPSTAPAWWFDVTGTNLFWGSLATGAAPAGSRLYRVQTSTWGTVAQFNSATSPAAGDCTSDFLALANVTNSPWDPVPYLYVGEMNGFMHAVDAVGTFTLTRPGFPFRDAVSAIRGGAVLDFWGNRLFYGNAAGSLYTLGTFAGAWSLGTNYFRFATTGGPIQTMPLYLEGVLYASNANGSLYVLDVNTGAGQALIRTWNLGITAATNDVGDVSRDFNTSRIYVGTSGGRLYSVPVTTDPTPAAP
jgi:hypothetical protein